LDYVTGGRIVNCCVDAFESDVGTITHTAVWVVGTERLNNSIETLVTSFVRFSFSCDTESVSQTVNKSGKVVVEGRNPRGTRTPSRFRKVGEQFFGEAGFT
jgi:hypothetical protein